MAPPFARTGGTMIGPSRVRIASLFFVCAACSPSSPAPVDVVASADDANFDGYYVSWRRTGNASPFASTALFEVQWRLDSGPWSTSPRRFDDFGAYVTVDPATPEGALLFFRVRGLRGTSASEWSTPVSVRRGVRAAADFSVRSVEGISISLRWTRRSALADGIRVERRVVNLDLSKGPWETGPQVNASDTSYQETDLTPWLDGHALEYRIFYTFRTMESVPVTATSGFTRPLPPIGVSATVEDSTVVLAWTNASRIADHVQIVSQFSELTVVPAASSSARIGGLAPGLHAFALKAIVGQFTAVINYVSDPVGVSAFVRPPGNTLPARVVRTGNGDMAVRSPDGAFVVGCSIESNFVVSVLPDNGPAYRTLEDATAAQGGLLVDAAGAPHLVYIQDSAETFPHAMPIEHATLDGSWNVETISLPTPGTSSPNVPLYAGIDPRGTLHILFSLESQFDANAPHHASNPGGIWSEELVKPVEADVALSNRSAMAVRADGSPAFLANSSAGYGFVARDQDGWHVETIPGTTLDLQPVALLTGTSPETALAFFLRTDLAASRKVLDVFERTATGWLSSVAAASWPVHSGPFRMSFAISKDGARIAIVDNASTPMLWLREGGVWQPPVPLAPDFLLACGFTPGGKLWVLGNLPVPECFGGTGDHVLYEEP